MAEDEQPEPEALAAGTKVDHFKVVRLVGRGGMGEVYLARDTKLGRKVALKVVRAAALGDQDAIDRFLFEARATAQFSHPHIITIFAVGEHEGAPYVALEYLDGRSLEERLRGRTPGLRETLRIGRAVADALAEAHRHQIIHRDLKPDNVHLPRDGRLRVLDFGLAKVFASPDVATAATMAVEPGQRPSFVDGDVLLTRPDGLRGTPLYMAPEQWVRGPVGAAADMWALGLILFQMLGGDHPFAGLRFQQIFLRVAEPEPMPRLAGDVPSELVDLVARCLDKDPAKRPAAAEALAVLDELLAGTRPGRAAPAASPFRGLLPFSERHAGQFFGRDAEVAAFVERLRDEPVLPVVGPSGAGKSSFVQAGVVPRLREQRKWVVLRVRPGADPLRALAARVLAGESGTPSSPTISPATSLETPGTSTPSLTTSIRPTAGVEEQERRMAAELAESPPRLALWLGQLAERERAAVLLFIDQVEELYTLVDDPQVRRSFMEALCAAADDPQGPVRVVFTLRDDFLGRVGETRAAREALSRVTVLRTPGPEALRECLVRPVEAVGYAYDDPRLPDDMVAAVQGESAALPLLQFAGQMLWERRDERRRLLLRAKHEEIGGVAGALAHHADGALEGLSPSEVRLAREILLRLVTGEGTRRTVPRGRLLDGLDPRAADVLERLTQARTVLVRRARGEAGAEAAEVELVHESLVRTWKRLARWLEESREERAFLAEALQAAELWEKRGRRGDEVWQGDALRDALCRTERIAAPPPAVRAFLDAGRRVDRRKARRRRWFVGALIAGLAAVAVVLGIQGHEASVQRDRADEQRVVAEQQRATAEVQRAAAEEARAESDRRQAEVLLEGARAATSRRDMFEARAKVRASLELQDSVGARALWHALAADPLLWRRPIWANAEARIAWAPDGSRVAVAIGGGWFYVVDPATGEARQLRSGGGGVFSVAFSPDGRRFLQACADGKVSLVDPETGEEKKVLYRRPDPGGAIADFAPDGRRILVTAVNGPVLLVDAASGEVVLAPEIGNATSATIDAGGALLAVGRYDGTIDVLEVPSGAPRATLRGHDGVVLGVAFDASGGRLASVGKDRTVRLWDVARGAQLGSTPCQPESVRGHDLRFEGERLLAACAGPDSIRLVDGSIGRLVRELGRDVEMPSGVAFAPDGKRLFAAGLNEIRVWDLTRPEPSGTQAGHDKSVMTLAFSPDGLLVASAALDGTIRLWDADSGEPRGTLLGHEGNIYAVGFSPDGARLASGGQDQLIHVWDVRSLTSAYELRGHTDVVWSLAFTPDGRLLASASNDRTVRLWDVATGAALGVLEGHEGSVRAVAIRPDGRELASGAADKTVRLWELPSGRPLRTLRGHEGRVFSVVYGPDGRTPASMGIDGTIRLWNVADGAARLFAGAEKLRAGLPPGTPLSILDAAFDPTGRTLAATVGGGYVLWNVADGAETGRLAWLSGAGTRIRFSGDGRRLAVTDNTVVRLFDAATLRPVWHAPVLLHGPARLRTHRGWIGLDAPDLAVGLAPTAWRSAVEERALFAEETPDGRLLCLLTFDGSLEVWSPERDERVREEAIGRPALAFAVGGGCATVSEGKARFFPREGDPVLLSDRAASIDVSRDEIFVSTGREILTFDDGGAPKATYAQPGIIAAVTRLGSALALGFQEGPIEIRGVEGRAGAPPVVLQDTPTQPPARMLALPGGLLAAAFLNGFVGIWNPLDGELLMSAKLNGPAMHLRLDRDVEAERDYLYAASDLGDYARLDVGVFREDYCRLLREVWTRVSTSWEGGRAVPATPPERHRCAGP